MGFRASEGQCNLAEHLTGFEPFVGPACLGHGEGLNWGGFDAAIGVERPCNLTDPLANLGFFFKGARPQASSGDEGALVEKLCNIELSLDAALHSNDVETPANSESIDVEVEVLSAHDVEDDVGTTTPRSVFDAGNPVLVIVEGDVGTESAAELLLLGGATGGDDRAFERLGVLDSELADAAGAAVHEEGFTPG